MNKHLRYLHELEQLSTELRDAADELEECFASLQRRKLAGELPAELKASHSEFIKHSQTLDVIGRLNKLAQRMNDDEELTPAHKLEPDMINANQHALRMCTAMLDITKLLAGV